MQEFDMSSGAKPGGEERLANRWVTFFIRFVWPVFGLGSIPGFLISLAWWRTEGWGERIFFGLAVFLLMPAYYLLVSRPLRWVWAGPDGLRVSNGLRDVRVPYSEIEDVRGFWYARDLVRIVLRRPTTIGQRFIFIPTFRLSLRGDHPVVGRLRVRAGLTLDVPDIRRRRES